MTLPLEPQTRLTCPECAGESLFSAVLLIPGNTLPCPHCGAELVLTHDRDVPAGPPIWRLECPDSMDEQRPGEGHA